MRRKNNKKLLNKSKHLATPLKALTLLRKTEVNEGKNQIIKLL